MSQDGSDPVTETSINIPSNLEENHNEETAIVDQNHSPKVLNKETSSQEKSQGKECFMLANKCF